VLHLSSSIRYVKAFETARIPEDHIRSATALRRDFFERPADVVARDLLGKILVRREGNRLISGRIVEVEAYFGPGDPGSHARNGPTPRSIVMFGPPGHAYVYFCYGMHYLFNVVTEPEGTAGAVLVRALEPLTGIAVMFARRKTDDVMALCSGPARLTQALGIDLTYNSLPLEPKFGLYVADDGYNVSDVIRTPRIGIPQHPDDMYRLIVVDSPFVSSRTHAGRKRNSERRYAK